MKPVGYQVAITRDVPDIRYLSGYPAIRPIFHYPESGYPVSGLLLNYPVSGRISCWYPAGYRIIAILAARACHKQL